MRVAPRRDDQHDCDGDDGAESALPSESDRQVRSLIGALLAVYSGLDVDGTLRTIVEYATKLVDANYIELRVAGESGEVENIVTVGIDGRARARGRAKPDCPHRSLQVPIVSRGEVFGSLHLYGKSGAHGFSEQDRLFVQALASAAGIAIDNSQLFEMARIKQDQLRAGADVATALLGDPGPESTLQIIADRSLALTDSICAFLAVAEDADSPSSEVENLVIAVASGSEGSSLVGQIIPVENSTSGQAYKRMEPVISSSLEYDQGIDDGSLYGSAMALPLRDGRRVLGVLTVLKGRSAPQYDHDQLALMAAFADQAALALHLADGRSRIHELSLLSDRERIARDLHDHVIQRVFAVGLSVQGTLQRTRSPEVRRRLQGTMNDLQEIIQDIRRTIFDLHDHDGEALSLTERLREIVAETTADTELRVALHVKGPVSVIEAELSAQVEAVLREALSNVVRHAHASAVAVELSVDDDLSITVEDDGVGFAPDIHWSGLTNLAARAAELGGTFMIQPGSGAGSLLAWTVPIP